MAKILHNNEWYEQISTEALYEEEYERLLLAHADSLFPNYRLLQFKMMVSSEDATAKADFALVHKKYRDWWVVEAELSHHPFEGHVRPQVETLSRALYGEDVAHYLHEKDPSLDLARLCSMLRGQQPRVLVIVNASMSEWARELKRYDALVTILEVFRSRHNRHVYRLNGEHPVDTGAVVSLCNVELSRFLRVLSPGILPIQNGEKMSIFFRDGLTDWDRLDISDRVYLVNSKPVSLNSRATYELVERETSEFILVERP